MHVKILRDYGSFLKHFSGARWPKTNSEPGHVPGLAGPTKALIWWASVEEKKAVERAISGIPAFSADRPSWLGSGAVR